jgi:hypothetical protein
MIMFIHARMSRLNSNAFGSKVYLANRLFLLLLPWKFAIWLMANDLAGLDWQLRHSFCAEKADAGVF